MFYLLKPMLRQPWMPVLIVLQVALACSIACNALFLLQQKLAPILAPNGVRDPGQLVLLSASVRGNSPSPGRIQGIEADLHAVQGVTSVTYGATLPMVSSAAVDAKVYGPSGGSTADTVLYFGDNLVNTLDLRLVEGRDFTLDERMGTTDIGMKSGGPVIVTQALAERLYPGGDALGQMIHESDSQAAGMIIVGIVSHLMKNKLGKNANSLGYAILVPGIPAGWPFPEFAVRASDGTTSALCKDLTGVVRHDFGSDLFPGETIECDSYLALRHRMLTSQRAAVWLLSGITLIVLVVTLTGVVGITSDWVEQHIHSIGIKRAMGATRRIILRELLAENLCVVGVGAITGMIAAYGINLWLMQHFELARLPWIYLPLGAVMLLLLGQIAVLTPALRASHVSPIEATRSA